MKQILIAKEKHGTRYFDASTPEALALSSFKLLKERWNNGNGWYWLDDPPEDKDVLSEEQIAALPSETLRASETAKRNQYLCDLKNWEYDKEEYDEIKNCIESGQQNNLKNRAWRILNARNGCEYESVQLQTLE